MKNKVKKLLDDLQDEYDMRKNILKNFQRHSAKDEFSSEYLRGHCNMLLQVIGRLDAILLGWEE